MIDGNPPPAQWVEMAWAARNAAQPGMNNDRRAWFEGVKCLLDAPKMRVSVNYPPANIVIWGKMQHF